MDQLVVAFTVVKVDEVSNSRMANTDMALSWFSSTLYAGIVYFKRFLLQFFASEVSYRIALF